MTKQKTLEKVLLKAHKNGWKPLSKEWKNVEIQQWQGNGLVGIALLYSERDAAVHWVRELEGIIFNKDFARALWGIEKVCFGCGGNEQNQRWCGFCKSLKENRLMPKFIFHLKQMVGAEDPIKYLGENI